MRPRELIGCRSTLVSIVWRCPLDVSAYLALGQQIEVGEHACPGPECEQRRLGGWSGYWRWVRGPGTGRLWIRRGRCSRCLRSHALLPDFLLERRLDAVEVIGHALALGIVGGLGHAERGGSARGADDDGARVAATLSAARPSPGGGVGGRGGAAGSSRRLLSTHGETAALEALGAAWQRARTRFGERVPAVWRFWSLICRWTPKSGQSRTG